MGKGSMSSHGAGRPPVSVILPFHGSAQEADEALAALATLELRDGDEILVADNTPDGVLLGRPGAAGVTAFETEVKRSAYAARNIAMERAVNDWLLLIDADCRPRPDLLDRYFDPPPDAGTGAVAGQVLGVPDQPGLIPRYIRARRHLDQAWLVHEHPYRPMAVTANLLLRRAAWEEVGGFAEQTRSGADEELCWRLQDAGWGLELRLEALVHHEHRASLSALLKQSARDGAGGRWASRRHAGYPGRPKVARLLIRAAGGALVWALRGKAERAAFKLIDAVWMLAAAFGSLQSNAAPAIPPPSGPATVALLDRFPLYEDPALDKLAAEATGIRIEAAARPDRADWRSGRALNAHLAEDDGPGVRAVAMGRIALRRPAAAAAAVASAGRTAFALAPAAVRLAADPPGTKVAAVPERTAHAELLARLAGRPAAGPPALLPAPSGSIPRNGPTLHPPSARRTG